MVRCYRAPFRGWNAKAERTTSFSSCNGRISSTESALTELRPATNVQPAAWLVADLTTFAKSVNSLVPSGFASYVRVFHPAWRDHCGHNLISWAEIAAATGARADPAMQLHSLVGDLGVLSREAPRPEVFARVPEVGSLPAEVMTPLIGILAANTSTPDTCWFAVWEGWGALKPDIRSAPTFPLPNRTYHLLRGPIQAASESAMGAGVYNQSASLWWPEDRAWCVATEIDLNSTYIGCDDACADAILAERSIEALVLAPSTGIDWRSDPLNPFPEE
jgi:hypothetical protein